MIENFLKYLASEKRLSAHTIHAYQIDLKQFEEFLNKNFQATSEQADHGLVRAWLVALVDNGLEPPSVNRKIATLRAYYRFLLRQEKISRDPMKKVVSLKTRKRLPSFIKEGEISTLLDAPVEPFISSFEGIRDKLILEMFYATGIRLSELITLEDSNVNVADASIRVVGKRNKERVVPFPRTIIPLVKDYRSLRSRDVVKDSTLFFVTLKGRPCYPMQVYRMVKRRLSSDTSVEKRSPHVLRHSFATHLLDKGAEINAVKDLLGHSSLAATQVYTHNSMEKLKKTFDQAHPKA